MKIKTIPCVKCEGQGLVPAPDTGALLRARRLARGVTRKAVADAMGISSKYLSDLEEDPRKVWTFDRVKEYEAILEKADGKR